MFKTILFPIDQSRASQDAAEKVAEIVKFCNSKLVILSVQPDAENAPENDTPANQAIDQLLQNAKIAFSDWGIAAEIIKQAGRPAFCICDYADEINADLIVMGCRGVGLTEEGASESVSNRVINLAPCPVMVIP
ncbi:universal stress protein [Acaryochloris sp. 'Moss Beach']|uniref:universal stress protein n=1 Tax=Acaryochloris TaxID=155977 RepID=UPI001BB040C9|nr:MULTISPECIES: universal stress protein [Acaryochloris]QUY44519.1 universal stress protein [Acaryochloris marina S15]UJB69297.1 universal stress protein [Acaryochloris sp. 'Moss Beach']